MDSDLFSALPDNFLLKITLNLDDDPRDWLHLACVSKLCSLLHNLCYKIKTILSLVSDLLSGIITLRIGCPLQVFFSYPGLDLDGVCLGNVK